MLYDTGSLTQGHGIRNPSVLHFHCTYAEERTGDRMSSHTLSPLSPNCRTFAQLILHHLLEDFPEAQPEQARRPSPEASPSPSGPAPGPAPGSPWAACLAFFRTNPDMKRLESSLGPALRTYDPSQAITPAAVLHSVSDCTSVCVQDVTALLQ